MAPSPFKASTQILLAITQTQQQQIKNKRFIEAVTPLMPASCHCCQLHEENNPNNKLSHPHAKKSQKDKTLKMFYISQDLSLDHGRTARRSSTTNKNPIDIETLCGAHTKTNQAGYEQNKGPVSLLAEWKGRSFAVVSEE
jgi:hypothetical protein